MVLALQLRFVANSESMTCHAWEVMDDGRIGRDDAGIVGGLAAGREGADAGLVHAGACGCIGWVVP